MPRNEAGGTIGVAIFVDAALGGAGLANGRNMADQPAIQITGLIVVLLWSLVLTGLRGRASICASAANAATTYNTAGVG